MSAIHITAEAGRTYLTYTGRRLRVHAVRANRVEYFDLDEINAGSFTSHRSSFERGIESVIE